MFAALGMQEAGLRSNTDTKINTKTKTNTDTGEDQAVRKWISQLPATTREQLMQKLMKDLLVNRSKKVLNTSTDHKNLLDTNSIDRLQILERTWRHLFSPDWRRVALVDLGRDQVGVFPLTFFLRSEQVGFSLIPYLNILNIDGRAGPCGRSKRPAPAACQIQSQRSLWTSS